MTENVSRHRLMPHRGETFSVSYKPLKSLNNNPTRGNASNVSPLYTPEVKHLSGELRDLALRVERLGVSGRTDPETILTEKQLIARAIRRLAKEADG